MFYLPKFIWTSDILLQSLYTFLSKVWVLIIIFTFAFTITNQIIPLSLYCLTTLFIFVWFGQYANPTYAIMIWHSHCCHHLWHVYHACGNMVYVSDFISGTYMPFKYTTYMCNLMGILVSGTYMAVTFTVDFLISCDMVHICTKVRYICNTQWRQCDLCFHWAVIFLMYAHNMKCSLEIFVQCLWSHGWCHWLHMWPMNIHAQYKLTKYMAWMHIVVNIYFWHIYSNDEKYML